MDDDILIIKIGPKMRALLDQLADDGAFGKSPVDVALFLMQKSLPDAKVDLLQIRSYDEEI